MSGEKILVADDRRENLVFLADSVLRPEGYQVVTAVDGREAFSKALAEKPDLIITDLKMPRMSGLEMMTALRKAGSKIPVILTTFYGSEQTAIQAFRLGARDYLVKPYDIADMLESVEQALIEVRLRRETRDLKEGAQVRRHLEERVRQLNSLCGIGKAVSAIRDPDEVMRVVVEAAIHLTGAHRSQLSLVVPETGDLELRAVRGSLEARAISVRQPSADPIAERVIQTGQAVLAERDDGLEKVSCLAVPLRAERRVIGILGVDAKPEHVFSDGDNFQLSILADFAGVALSNAQLIVGIRNATTVPSRGPSVSPEGAAEASPAPDVADSVAEAQRLSAELRSLADAARDLADKLQGQGASG